MWEVCNFDFSRDNLILFLLLGGIKFGSCDLYVVVDISFWDIGILFLLKIDDCFLIDVVVWFINIL